MRDLDNLNPDILRPSKLTGISVVTSFALTFLAISLADGAAANIPITENPILFVIFIIFGMSALLALASLIFRWGWKAKHYGIPFLSFASVSYLGIVPCLAVVLYSNAPYWIRGITLLVYGVSHFFWCRKFTLLYARAFSDAILRASIYEEESDAVYYMRRGDEFLLEKYFKFSQMPQDRYFAFFIVVGIAMIPLMSSVRTLIGLPSVHVFLLVAMLPVSWMGIGFAVRGFLIFYLYPTRIKKMTGKDVYVDLVNKPRCRPVKPR